mmetsp:Transcript_23225/g.17657  ORF Transcript_23225/g.17657 Transcript_23225/m.17657 type:complete len:87 (-) Transcript_23225:168-428(-)
MIAEENKTNDFGKLGKATPKQEDITVVFAIDVSGSMSGQRISMVKHVMTKAIRDLAKNHPERKVGIVLFESSVTVLGDCSQAASPI